MCISAYYDVCMSDNVIIWRGKVQFGPVELNYLYNKQVAYDYITYPG